MITNSGRAVFPSGTEGFTGEAPSLTDIGRGLGRTVRFAGQCDSFYSVLCHTIVCASIIDQEHAIHALLHDAPEAVFGDTPTTWKHDLTREDEDSVLALIYAELGLEPSHEALDAVKEADLACLAAEAHALGHAAAEKYWPKDQWGELEERAFSFTMQLLQQNAPLVFLDGVKAGQYYKEMVEKTIDPEAWEKRQRIKAIMR